MRTTSPALNLTDTRLGTRLIGTLAVLLLVFGLLAPQGAFAGDKGTIAESDILSDVTLRAVTVAWVDTTSDMAATGIVPEYDDFDDEYGDEQIATINDPLEGWNRFWFKFNDVLYFNAIKPLAQGYNYVIPEQLRVGIRNIFSNLLFPVRFLNNLLQGKFNQAAMELSKFQINTFGGFGGFGDLSDRHPDLIIEDEEDFGQTLGIWGFGDGCFLVWPILGPSSVRDTVGFVGDSFADPFSYVTPWYDSFAIKSYRSFNDTSLRLGDYETLIGAAVDPYTAMRNGYVQYRAKKLGK